MITLIPAGNPGPYTGPGGNNTWLVDGEKPLLVDAGTGLDAHIDALRQAVGGRRLATLFVTHGHRDHSGGVPRLRQEFPGLRVVGAGGEPIEAATRLTTGDRELDVLPTPGHSADHACLWDSRARVIFGGDLLVAGGTVLIAESSGGNLLQYLDSLMRVRALSPNRVYPAHGSIIDDPVELIDRYIAHRAMREQQIVAALERGPADRAALVSIVYPELPPALRKAAAETVLAHLKKLEEDGRAIESNGTWRLS
jgi:glyoxylase-like metal-dependent hydrolase (beta-lactamase superfamily II)